MHLAKVRCKARYKDSLVPDFVGRKKSALGDCKDCASCPEHLLEMQEHEDEMLKLLARPSNLPGTFEKWQGSFPVGACHNL